MSEQVTVIARSRAKAGMEKQLRQALQSVLAPTRAEAGCINYDLHESVDDPRSFLFHENWTSAGHLDAHLKSAHIRALFESLRDLVETREITVWKAIA
jgi:quinol monooxygenase YgiN